jgi:Acetoacetate decarboxylase (ADC)
MASTYDVAGTTVTMPVEVRDASAGTAVFDVDADAAGALLPGAFEVVAAGAGRTHLAVVVVDYRDNDLGSYLEVGLMLFVRPRAGGDDGTFIFRLPVDEPFTCEAGRLIWGFPKTLEQIELDYAESAVTATLHMDGELVLRLTLPRDADADGEMPPTPMTAYTVIDGAPHATTFIQGGTGFSMNAEATLELGSHPIAKELAGLGLLAAPAFTTWTEHMRASFEGPVPSDAAPTRR